MPYYKAIVHIPGGKELKIENNSIPEELFIAVQKVSDPEIIEIYTGDLQLTEELHKKLHKPKEFNTYVVYGGWFPEEVTDTPDYRNFILQGIKFSNLYTKIETVFSYQVVKLEYIYGDDVSDYEKDVPK